MSKQVNQETCPCNAPIIKKTRLLIFPDDSRVGVIGLDKIFDDAFREGKSPDRSIAHELVSRLSENNYIPSAAWTEYEAIVLKEYRKFFEAKEKGKAENKP
jgi:hypothetical protein